MRILGQSFQKLPNVIDLLCKPEMDFLRQEKGGQEYFKENRTTAIYPTERLVSRIWENEVQIDDLATKKFRETIVLKRPKSGPFDKGERIEYEDSPVTKRYRDEMGRSTCFSTRRTSSSMTLLSMRSRQLTRKTGGFAAFSLTVASSPAAGCLVDSASTSG